MHHFCLISDQPMPNFLPLLQDDLRPESITLAVSRQMREKAGFFKEAVQSLPFPVAITEDVVIENPADIAGIEAAVLAWVDAHQGEDIVLNVTGGMKPMAIAAQEVFRMAGKPVFYVDIATDKVMWIGETRPVDHLANEVTLSQFFRANGIKKQSGTFRSLIPEGWHKLATEFAARAHQWPNEISLLNEFASAEEDSKKRDVLNGILARARKLGHWQNLLGILYDNGLSTERDKPVFPDADSRRFCNGLWLEHYLWSIIQGFGFSEKHALMNCVVADTKGTTNEWDAVVLHRNTLYILECKTKNLRKSASDAIYKLSELTHRSGLRSKGILVSALPLSKPNKQRAESFRVDAIDNLPRLEEQLKRILRI